MKNIELRFSIAWIAFLSILVSACGPSVSEKTADMELKLTGEMLFEGANSLQFAMDGQLEDLAGTLGVDVSAIQNATVSSVVIELDDASRQIAESLLLQVVSDNKELVTIGTLNPLPEAAQLSLSLAQNTSILPYLKDKGTTWVLDLNIAEDYMDEMVVNAKLKLSVDYIPNKN